jgi:uncharacterized repeat protein (TIGR01451 family)
MKRTTVSVSTLAVVLAWAAVAQAGPNVQITKRCPDLRYLGRDATFELVVTNTGDAPALDVVVTDVLPDGMTFRTADNNGKVEGRNLVWRLGNLAPGQSVQLGTVMNCGSIGRFRNTAMVSYRAEAMAECELEVRGIPAILLECVDDPDPIEVNGTLVYTISVTNQGSAVGTNIRVTCTLPQEEEFVQAEGPTQGAHSGQTLTFEPLPSLAPKATATYKVTVRGVGEGDVRFRVEMISDQIDSPVMETESTHIYR